MFIIDNRVRDSHYWRFEELQGEMFVLAPKRRRLDFSLFRGFVCLFGPSSDLNPLAPRANPDFGFGCDEVGLAPYAGLPVSHLFGNGASHFLTARFSEDAISPFLEST